MEHGERVLLLGASGSGKSSLLLAIAGLHDRSTGGLSEGSLVVDGRSPADAAGDVGILFQDAESQLVMARAGDDVAFGLEERCVPTGEIPGRVDAALRAVAFPYGPRRRTDALSGGEKQRLALAGVLALRPRILLLDEPTADLDPEGAAALYATVARLDRGTTIVLVEHRVADALPLVDRIVAVDGERGVIADGDPGRVLREGARDLERAGIWLPGATAPRTRAREAGEVVLAASSVTVRYPGASRPALAPTDASARAGEAVAFTGANGSGKTTLLLLLGGLIRPSGGRIAAPALDAARPDPAGWPARTLAARVGSVFQDPAHQFVSARVVDDVLAGPTRIGMDRAQARRRADALLERLRLAHVRDADPHTLSGGEQRRLGLAGVLACAPRALLLDEPTYGQDRRTFLEIAAILSEERARGTAVAFSTHERALVDAIADREQALERAT